MSYNSKYKGSEVEGFLDKIPKLEELIGSHNKEVKFFCIEPVVVKVGDIEYNCNANEIATVFVGDEEFEIIPTSDKSIKSLLNYPIPLTWFDWLEGVDVFENIIFDMNTLEMSQKWTQYYQGEYHVQKAQYSNCIFWNDKPYTHSPFEERTNYTLYYTSQLPLCYATNPANTYKPFYFAYGVQNDPNWRNPDYINSFASLTSGAPQTFSYYGAKAIGIFNYDVDIIKLCKDCRGLMYDSSTIEHAGIFDATNTTNFGAKKGSWQDAFGKCYSLTDLFIKNLKASINVSWSPINNRSIEYIVNNAINTSKITISLSPYTWYRLTDAIREAAASKNITLELITTNYVDDSRWTTKQDKIEDLDTIRTGAEAGATALQEVPEEYITETELNDRGYATTSALNDKVDKEEGKGLSTEDFTSALKTKLEGLSNYDDTEIENAITSLQTQFNTLVSGNASDAINSFNEIISFLDGVKDTEDLSSIIASIEQQIAGKMDKVTLATVATSGSYNDLSNKPTIPSEQVNADWNATSGKAQILNKPTIPSAVTESTVSGWGFTKNTGTYSKPSTGIPKTDLATAVQTSLEKADTALQSYTEQYKGTITGVSANGTSVATSGVANIPAASTSKYGVTKLSSATNSTSTTLAATASAVKAAYDLANSYKGTVTGVKINGSTKSPSSGTVDLGNVVTSIKINGSTKTPSNGVVDLGTIEGGNSSSGGSSSGGSESFNPITLNPSTTAIELVNSGVYILDCTPYANYTITINGQGNFTLLISCNLQYGSISIRHNSGKIVWTAEKTPIFASKEVTELSLCSLPTSTSAGYIVLGTWARYNATFSDFIGGGWD